MAARPAVALLLLLGLVLGTSARREEFEFMPEGPRPVLETEGGRVDVWSPNFEQIKDASVGAAKICIKPKGLVLPHYTNAAMIGFVVKGSACMGLVTPFGIPTNARCIKEGDVILKPRAWAHWLYNSGEDNLEIFCVAETSAGPNPGNVTKFWLAGGEEEHRSILHGFSKDVLAKVWDTEEKSIEKLLSSQKRGGIIKVEEELKMPTTSSKNFLLDFVFDMDGRNPDICVENGGCMSLLHAYKVPCLKKMGLGVARVKLEPGAILAPHWCVNAADILYVTKGKGRVQVAMPDGTNGFDKNLKKGDLIIIPKNFPSTQIADKTEGFEWITITTCPCTLPAFLVGKNSVFRGMPSEVLKASFNINDKVAEEMCHKRSKECVIFPPSEEGRRHSKLPNIVPGWAEEVASYKTDSSAFEELAQMLTEAELGVK
eukprot:SM000034S12780  [mRNA]  locus=s34:784892:787631:+ [translate_table: standard]